MPVHNSDVAEMFERMADLLEIKGANRFRVRSYRDAAQTVSSLSADLADMVERGEDLTELSGVGDSLAGKIEQMVETGTVEQLEKLESEIPPGLRDMMKVEGLGPKRVKTIWEELGAESLDELETLAREERIRELEGFGPKTEQNILEGMDRARVDRGRTRIDIAEERAEAMIDYLREDDAVDRVTAAGSYRRRKETVGDLDILVSCDEPEEVTERFVQFEDVVEVVSQGSTRSTVYVRGDFQVDLRVVPEESYGAAMKYFTGSKEHNVACRQRGVERDLKINEYGVFEGEDEERVGGATEEEIYDLIDLEYVPPELREARGEVDAAAEGELPDLVEADDIRGELHSHTTATDGANELREMVEAAREFGYEYLGITDHSKAMTVAGGLDADRLRDQMSRIDALNGEYDDFTILKGCEVDILEDGSLDLPDDVLEELDYTICSVHSKFGLDREEQTARIVRAAEHPQCDIVGHLTGRMIGKREGYDVNVERVLEAAAEHGSVPEINAQPKRLDLKDIHVKQARELGLPVVVTTDAHSTDHFRYVRYGVDQARRGWLEADDVLNTRPVDELLEALSED